MIQYIKSSRWEFAPATNNWKVWNLLENIFNLKKCLKIKSKTSSLKWTEKKQDNIKNEKEEAEGWNNINNRISFIF